MNKRIFVCFLGFIVLCSLVGSGCQTSSPAGNPSNVAQTVGVKIVDYGNGVYYFDSTRADFGNMLSSFLATHPELRLLSMAVDDTGAYGTTIGYFVVFKKS